MQQSNTNCYNDNADEEIQNSKLFLEKDGGSPISTHNEEQM